jgi:MoxR-like ATPase
LEGTYPLPEAQLDRFFFKLEIGYPDHQELQEIVEKTTEDYQYELNRVMGADEILEMKSIVKLVPIATHVKDYAIRLALASHPDSANASEQTKEYVLFGASPRGVQSLILAGKVSALLDGRYNVSIEDINEVAKPALRHRIVLNIRGETEGIDMNGIIDGIISKF